MTSRPTFDQMFLGIAHKVAERSTCRRLKVGAVLVNTQHRIIATGYNGSPRKTPHCIDEGCLLNDQGRCVRCIHAELNTLLFASSEDARGGTMFVTHQPCEHCIKAIIQCDIARVVYSSGYTSSCSKTNEVMRYFERFIQMECLSIDT